MDDSSRDTSATVNTAPTTHGPLYNHKSFTREVGQKLSEWKHHLNMKAQPSTKEAIWVRIIIITELSKNIHDLMAIYCMFIILFTFIMMYVNDSVYDKEKN